VTRAFEITYDYRCPFARNAHEQPDVWDDPDSETGLLALQASAVVRDKFPERFHAVHRALFALRHDEGLQLKDPAEVRRVLEAAGVDAGAAFEEITTKRPLLQVKDEHNAAAENHKVWGVPTFIQDGQSVFVRLMHRPKGDAELATTTIERVLDLLTWPELNEFKHTSIPR